MLKNQNLKVKSYNKSQTKKIIDDLKMNEDYWKNFNKINTSIRLDINIKLKIQIIINF